MNKALYSFFFLISSLSISEYLHAQDIKYQSRGYLFARLSSYTEDTPKDYGQLARGQFEQDLDLTSKLVVVSQLRWTSNSLNQDLNTNATLSKSDTFDVHLGENYLKYKAENWVFQLGYQEVVWGEAFGFNYADIISPKDRRETLYSDASDARLPLLLANEKTFFSFGDFSGSLQLLYSPEPRFSRTLPVGIFTSNLFPNYSISADREKTPHIFKNSEYGGKLATSYKGLDLSLYSFSYIDRDPHYLLKSATLTSINLKEEHTKVQSNGLSLAKTLFDFVARTDVVMTKDKTINYLENTQLKTLTTEALDAVVSVDSPTFHDYSGALVFARSSLKNIMPNSTRDKLEQYAILKITRDFGSDKNLEFSYTHEIEHTGHSIQSFFNWPINSSTDLKFGGQFYSGNSTSNLNKLKNVSSVFFSLKNYFQL